MKDLQDRVAVVTGAASGIGNGIAAALAQAGVPQAARYAAGSLSPQAQTVLDGIRATQFCIIPNAGRGFPAVGAEYAAMRQAITQPDSSRSKS